MNLAEKSTIHMRKTASVCLTSVHPDLMKILGDINCDFARYVRTGRKKMSAAGLFLCSQGHTVQQQVTLSPYFKVVM